MTAPDLRAPVVVLTGAGISAESGLATFRDAGGIWARVRIEDVATPDAFARHPERVHAFYNARRRQLLSPRVCPNAAHRALATLEAALREDMLLATQNIDDLHERAGSRRVLHLHGELLKARCAASGRVFPWREDIAVETLCPCCGRAGTLRPHVVWFGEMPLAMDHIHRALMRCRTFVAIGTSGAVYPAAGFVDIARHQARAHTVELNLEPSAAASAFAEHRYGRASETVPAFVARLLAGIGGATGTSAAG